MTVVRRLVPLLRAALVLLFGLLLVLQWLSFPGKFAYEASLHPEQAWLRWSLAVLVGVGILCVQVVLVCTWRLLTMVQQDRIFSAAALAWVNGIVWALVVAWTLAASGSLWAVWGADDPGAPLLLFTFLAFGAVFSLVVVVMRELLRRATVLRDELDMVV